MTSINESREAERGSDRFAASDDFAIRLARVVFEWRPALPSSTRSPASELWMSRNVRGSRPEG